LNDELIAVAGEESQKKLPGVFEDSGIEAIEIRSVLTCESKRGVWCEVLWQNLATGYTTQKGDAVGIIAAQSIGEPGTQFDFAVLSMWVVWLGPHLLNLH